MPRVTPFSKPTWKRISRCAEAVEDVLSRAGIALTMGGEPTFVPLMPVGAEWQTDALGPTKLAYARRLARELVERALPGAVVLETFGKLYPGEPLPRWGLLVQRRADGKPLWRDPRRLCAGIARGRHAPDSARRFIRALAEGLNLPAGRILAVAEDGARSASGHVLPLDSLEGGGVHWITDDWTPVFGRRPLPLFPGEAPAGLRLPLDRLGKGNVRRALTAEVVQDTLTIFIPPLLLAPYVALLGAIEDTLAKLRLRNVILTGYSPPPDPALITVGLASDPGVLEVNLAPVRTWRDYDAQLADVYSAAAACGLCARKLQFDGREVGTGGGAHVVLGGPEPAASPFFAFPGLLPSIIRYWQRHPALSYAFTGSYLGPGSQAPRTDESTHGALYELEIACAGAEALTSPLAPDLAQFDRLFRDLLMDRTGNTHRAEISVDKLWNPAGPNGRLGLVEFRAFETHPACAVQSVIALLVRAIVARLGAAPDRKQFRRWGGELHNRFFLPTFIWEDLVAICADLQRHGIPFDAEWLRPFWNWRFPRLGRLAVGGKRGRNLHIEFRQALEAWPLLGESPDGLTVVRRVDSSLDRIEARLPDAGALESGLLMINGLPCEFCETTDGGAAAGIRYRAAYLTPALQPHVPVHAPLLMEWVDRASLTVVAAARWHVGNPEGPDYTDRPRSMREAEARRARRWEPWTKTVGEMRAVPSLEFPPEARHTLDLRRYPAAQIASDAWTARGATRARSTNAGRLPNRRGGF